MLRSESESVERVAYSIALDEVYVCDQYSVNISREQTYMKHSTKTKRKNEREKRKEGRRKKENRKEKDK